MRNMRNMRNISKKTPYSKRIAFRIVNRTRNNMVQKHQKQAKIGKNSEKWQNAAKPTSQLPQCLKSNPCACSAHLRDHPQPTSVRAPISLFSVIFNVLSVVFSSCRFHNLHFLTPPHVVAILAKLAKLAKLANFAHFVVLL